MRRRYPENTTGLNCHIIVLSLSLPLTRASAIGSTDGVYLDSLASRYLLEPRVNLLQYWDCYVFRDIKRDLTTVNADIGSSIDKFQF